MDHGPGSKSCGLPVRRFNLNILSQTRAGDIHILFMPRVRCRGIADFDRDSIPGLPIGGRHLIFRTDGLARDLIVILTHRAAVFLALADTCHLIGHLAFLLTGSDGHPVTGLNRSLLIDLSQTLAHAAMVLFL